MQSGEPIVYRCLRVPLSALVRLFRRPVIEGAQHIPANGSAVLAGNHRSPHDIPLVIASTKRSVHFLGKDELFKGPLKQFFRASGVIPVNRRTKDKQALSSAEQVLRSGSLIGIFPEGTTKKSSEAIILPFKIGAVKMAYDTGSPIVPFTITGDYRWFKKSIKLKFYPPFYVEDCDLTRANEMFMERIIRSLQNEEN